MGEWFVDFLFTSSLLILAILALRILLRGKISMILQYAMWLAVAVKLLIFPVPWIESSLSVLNLTEAMTTTEKPGANPRPESLFTGESQTAADSDFDNESDYIWKTESTHQTNEPSPDAVSGSGSKAQDITGFTIPKPYWELLFCMIASGGTLFMAALLAVYDFRLNTLLKKKRVPYEQYQTSLPVYLMEGLPSPCLYKKAIYITPETAGDEQKLRHVLTHETCHYQHRDDFWSLVRLVCLACCWWHPLVWAAAYISRQDCELACDEAAIRQLGEIERIAYGWTLIGLIPQKAEPKDYFSLSTTMTGRGNHMKQRIKRIAKQPKVRISACIAFVLLIGLVLLCTITGKKQDAADGEEDTADWDAASSETSAESTNPEEVPNNGSTSGEIQAIFHRLVADGGMYYLNVYQIICDKNVDELSDAGDMVSQYRLDEMLSEGTIENTLIYRLSEDYDTEYATHYNQLCDQQAMAWEKLVLSSHCTYYIAKTVGSLEKTEVDYNEFITYFLDYAIQGKKCQVFFEDGYIREIVLLNPYKNILFQNVRINHDFYEEYGTDPYYELTATYEADVEHTVDQTGSEKEIIEVYTGNGGGGYNGMVLVKSASGDVLWDIEAHTAHIGWNNIYLTEVDGKEYLLELQLNNGYLCGGYSYYVYSLEQQLGVWDAPVLLSGASFSYGSAEELTEGNYELWADAMNPYLEDATLLLSTQDGVVRTEPVNERKIVTVQKPLFREGFVKQKPQSCI